MDIIHGWPRFMRPEVAAKYAGGPTNLKTLETEHGLRPVIQHKSNTTYDRTLVDQAMDRLSLTSKSQPEKKP